MPPAIDLTMLVLSAICVAEADGSPMTANDIAYLLEIPRKETALCLQELVAEGSVRRDCYFYHMSRELTGAQLTRMENLSNCIRQLCPVVDEIPVRLDS
jgi:DNA-binding IclR family transcriptional regulator